MRKFGPLALFVLLALAPAFAQFTTVTGTVIDPHSVPYALGTITPTLVANSTPTLNGFPYTPPTQPVGLDKNGSFSFNIADNNQLQPPGTQWNFIVCSAVGTTQPVVGTGSQCFTLATPLTITGATQNISTQLNAAALALTIPIGGGGIGTITPGAAPQQAVYSGTTTISGQNKPIYDTRDSMTCNTPRGSTTGTNVTAQFATLLNTIGTSQHATIRVIGSSNPSDTCLIATLAIPSNITLDFSGGGGFTLITDSTAPGGVLFDSGGSGASFNTNSSSCAVTVTPSGANETYLIFTAFGFGAGALVNPPTSSNSSDVVLLTPSFQSNTNASMLTDLWIVGNVGAGARTFTWNYHDSSGNPTSTWNDCHAIAVSGAGITPGLDGLGGSTANCGGCTSSPMTATATFQSGSFLLAYGGQHATTETCTSGGGGFTQPAGAVGQNGTSGTVCTMFINNSSAGSITANQNLSSTPTGLGWTYNVIGVRPSSATLNVLGGLTDPDNHQIFYNAFSGQGTVDFTGNLANFTVAPEWWGAGVNVSAATNTPASQASIYATYGKGRTNASGLSKYNKILFLNAPYQISDELKWYNVNNFIVYCNASLHGGFVQTVANKRIMDSQSMAYGSFHDCLWQDTANSTNALLDIDFNGVTTPGDFAPQFLSFYDNSFFGNGNDDVGLLGAKSGGGAQFSNIKLDNPRFSGFSGAGFQVGGNNTGRNAGRSYATNALAISVINGDFQNCPLYGLATYGAGYTEVHNTSFECTSPWASYLTALGTAIDVYGEGSQGPIIMDHVRSEDLQLIWSSHPVVNDSQNTDQSFAFYNPAGACLPGGTLPLNSLFHGSDVGSNGALYRVTVHGTGFGGTCLTFASSGSGTTIVAGTQTIPGKNTIGTFTFQPSPETLTQAVSGATATLVQAPVSVGTITGSVTSGTIGVGDTVTQAVTAVTCTVLTPAPTGSGNLLVNNCSGSPDNSHVYTDGTTGGTYTPTSTPSFAAANPVLIVGAITGAPDGTHNWTGGTSGAVYVPSGVPTNTNSFSVNQFVAGAGAQMQITIWNGTGRGEICGPITANTAQTITCPSGWTTNYTGVTTPVSPDVTSQFIIEPYWASEPTTSGDVSFTKLNAVIIGGDNAFGTSGQCDLTNVIASGGYIQCQTPYTRINGLSLTRPDWLHGVNGTYNSPLTGWDLQGVQVVRPYSAQAVPANSGGLNWSITNRNGPATIYTGAQQHNAGSEPIIWTSSIIGGQSLSDVGIGGRSYLTRSNALATSTFLNMVEVIGGTIGPNAPANTQDVNGNLFRIMGGPPRGAGTPGDIAFASGTSGASGASFTDGVDQWRVKGTTGNLVAQGGQAIQPALYQSLTNCAVNSVSPAACGSAPSGAVVIPTTTTTYTINTTAVTAHSRIQLTWLSFASDLPGGPTCVAPVSTTEPTVSAVSAGVSFTITLGSTTGQTCPMFQIVN
jgi:hypothetical protein